LSKSLNVDSFSRSSNLDMLAIPLSRFLVSMLLLIDHLYFPQVGHLVLPDGLLPMLVLPGVDLLTMDPLGLRVLVVVILTDCLVIAILLSTKEHTGIVSYLE